MKNDVDLKSSENPVGNLVKMTLKYFQVWNVNMSFVLLYAQPVSYNFIVWLTHLAPIEVETWNYESAYRRKKSCSSQCES